jgi:hypothetical protein
MLPIPHSAQYLTSILLHTLHLYRQQFAGLLNSNGQLGPAEIPNKRSYIMKDVQRSPSSLALLDHKNIALRFSGNCAVITKRFRSDFAAISQRFRSDPAAITKKFRSDHKAVPQRFHSDTAAITNRFYSDHKAIP